MIGEKIKRLIGGVFGEDKMDTVVENLKRLTDPCREDFEPC